MSANRPLAMMCEGVAARRKTGRSWLNKGSTPPSASTLTSEENAPGACERTATLTAPLRSAVSNFLVGVALLFLQEDNTRKPTARAIRALRADAFAVTARP